MEFQGNGPRKVSPSLHGPEDVQIQNTSPGNNSLFKSQHEQPTMWVIQSLESATERAPQGPIYKDKTRGEGLTPRTSFFGEELGRKKKIPGVQTGLSLLFWNGRYKQPLSQASGLAGHKDSVSQK